MTDWIPRPAEWVLPGHPDKLADAIADDLVAWARRRHDRALVGVEVAVHRNAVFVDGRIACPGARRLNVRAACTRVFREAGYDVEFGPHPKKLKVATDLDRGELQSGEAAIRELSDDQSIVTGWATTLLGTDGLPPEHALARRLALRLAALRAERPDLRLGPDGKVLVLLAERPDWSELHAASVSVSLQHAERFPELELHRAVRELVHAELRAFSEGMPGFDGLQEPELVINGAGDFSCGGTHGDNGLSGKKLVVDGYGPRVPIGGGALSGKDFWKVDRAGAIIARRLALAAAPRFGLRECRTVLSIRPGDREFRVCLVEGPQGPVALERVASLPVDLRLASVAESLPEDLDPKSLARWGHWPALDGQPAAEAGPRTVADPTEARADRETGAQHAHA
jgi:S-adenosylmethionine synthetase